MPREKQETADGQLEGQPEMLSGQGFDVMQNLIIMKSLQFLMKEPEGHDKEEEAEYRHEPPKGRSRPLPNLNGMPSFFSFDLFSFIYHHPCLYQNAGAQ